jgi:hypothetical protein
MEDRSSKDVKTHNLVVCYQSFGGTYLPNYTALKQKKKAVILLFTIVTISDFILHIRFRSGEFYIVTKPKFQHKDISKKEHKGTK